MGTVAEIGDWRGSGAGAEKRKGNSVFKAPVCPAYLAERAGGARAWFEVWRMFPDANRRDRILRSRMESAARLLAEARVRPTAAVEQTYNRQLTAIGKLVEAGKKSPAALPFLEGLGD